jgi:hypothetical protein
VALTPGEKLELIKQLTADLAGSDWEEIELTLDTFEADSFDERQGWPDNAGYIRQRLKTSADEVLVALHAHLHPDISTGITPTAGGPWKEGYVKLFLTHTHPNKVLAKQIRERLLLSKIDTFVAHEMIEVSKEWQEEIELALATCEALAALVTKDLIQSEYCDQEIGFAMGRGLVVIPIRQESNPHGFFSKYQGAPGASGDYAAWTIADGIFDTLIKNPKTKGKMGPAVVERYCTSTSFDYARKNTAYLLDLPKDMWTDEMVQAVNRAGSENSQLIKGIWSETKKEIPDVVSKHLRKLLGQTTQVSNEPILSDFAGTAAGDDDIPF